MGGVRESGKWNSVPWWWEWEMTQPLRRDYSKKWESRITFWSSNTTPGYLSKRIQNRDLKRYFPAMLIMALIATAEQWNSPECPLMGKWTEGGWGPHTQSTMQPLFYREGILSPAMARVDLKDIVQNKAVTKGQIPQDSTHRKCLKPSRSEKRRRWKPRAEGKGRKTSVCWK